MCQPPPRPSAEKIAASLFLWALEGSAGLKSSRYWEELILDGFSMMMACFGMGFWMMFS
jgi:hypothetical protein